MLKSATKQYSYESKIGEGTFSEVFKVKETSTGEFFAAKRLTRLFINIEEVEDYEELKVLQRLQFHTNVTHLVDYVYEIDCSRLSLIFNLMNFSLYDYIKDRKKTLSETRCKNFLFQLGHGLFYLHHNGIFHRDIKPENCLLRIDKTLAKSNPLRSELLQIGDLGSVSFTSYPLPRSEYISTRWYRPPECLLTKGYYGAKMDIWAVGCCFYEMFTLNPLFPGINEIDMLDKIHSVLGTPSRNLLERFKTIDLDAWSFPKKNSVNMHTFVPMMSSYGIDILKKTLAYHPDTRISAKKLLEHVYFDELKVSGDTVTTRLLYSKSDTYSSSSLRKSQTIVNQRKSYEQFLDVSSNSSIHSNSSIKSQLKAQQEKINYELERNWNNPQSKKIGRINSNKFVKSSSYGEESSK